MLNRFHGRVVPRLLRTLTTTTSAPNNYFKVLGVPQTFDVNTDELANRFKSLQREWHPDRHASGKTAIDPGKAANVSALLNEAYNALRTPHTRATHLLSILGEDDNPEMEPEFLAWVVEYREKIADVQPDSQQLNQLRVEVDKFCHQCLEQLSTSFSNRNLQEAAKQSAKLKYLWRMSSTLNEME